MPSAAPGLSVADLWHVRDDMQAQIRQADGKAGAILAFAAAVAHFGAARGPVAFAALVALWISAALALWCVWPRYPRRCVPGPIAWPAVAACRGLGEYLLIVGETDAAEAIAAHSYVLAQIVARKYRLISWATLALLAGLALEAGAVLAAWMA